MKVFITGASSGIGAALVRAYAQRGDACTLVSRRIDVLEDLRASLPRPDAHRSHAADVTDAAALAAVARTSVDASGPPDIVIANAGISGGTSTADPDDLGAFRRIVETNLIATVATFGPFIAAMKAAPRAGGYRLVVIASVAGIRGLPGSGAYCASKAAVIAYAESLRIELRGSGIRVVIVAPGFIDTPMTKANPYPMPFLMQVDAFAERALRVIDAGRSFRRDPVADGLARAAAARAARSRSSTRRSRAAHASRRCAGAMTLADARGTLHRRCDDRSKLRIVSLVPSLTELLCDLGLADAIVGRTGYCIHPADEVERIPKVGGTKTVNIEKIRKLAPTHLIVNIDENEKPDGRRDPGVRAARHRHASAEAARQPRRCIGCSATCSRASAKPIG